MGHDWRPPFHEGYPGDAASESGPRDPLVSPLKTAEGESRCFSSIPTIALLILIAHVECTWLADAVLDPQLSIRHTETPISNERSALLVCELGESMCATSKSGYYRPTLDDPIPVVVLEGSGEQVRGVATRPIVAAMTGHFFTRKGAVGQFISSTMGSYHFVTLAKYPITPIPGPHPQPAFI